MVTKCRLRSIQSQRKFGSKIHVATIWIAVLQIDRLDGDLKRPHLTIADLDASRNSQVAHGDQRRTTRENASHDSSNVPKIRTVDRL